MKTTRFIIGLLLLLFCATACREQSTRIFIDGKCIPIKAFESSDTSNATYNIIRRAGEVIDSIKAPVIGYADSRLTAYRPESPLMNFAADALRSTAQRYSSRKIDIAISNKGGLRNDIAEGDITIGDIYSVFPFDNTVTLLTLDGEQLLRLFEEIAAVGGEPISGVRIVIAPTEESYNVVSATIGGRSIEAQKSYCIATSDYLSQGNDGLTTLGKAKERIMLPVTIRDLMIEYITELHKQGEALSAKEDDRIVIKE